MLGVFMHVGFTMAILMSYNAYLDYALVFIFGLSSTARYYVGFSYLLEIQPKSHQVMASTVMFLFESFIYVIICLYFWFYRGPWQYLQIPNMAFTFLGIIYLFWTKESPRWLVSKKRYSDARKVFKWIGMQNGLDEIEADVRMNKIVFDGEDHKDLSACTIISTEDQQSLASRVYSIFDKEVDDEISVKALWKDPVLRRNLIASCFCWLFASFNFYMITFYLKYFPGNIYINSLTFAGSDAVAQFSSGVFLQYVSVPKAYGIANSIALTGGILYLIFW